jgi:hypothetical protein
MCVSLPAYRGAAVLFKLLDVLVAAAQPVPRLVGSFCRAAGFNAHGAERNGGTAVEWCAQWLAIALPRVVEPQTAPVLVIPPFTFLGVPRLRTELSKSREI